MLDFLPKIKYSIDGVTYDISNVFKKLEYTVPADKILTTTIDYGERPDQISQRLYGTPNYYWAIILANRDNPFINPIERLGETAKSTAELEAGEDIDPRDFFVQFSRSAFDVYIDDIDPGVANTLGISTDPTITDHRAVDFYKFIRPGDIVVFEPENENLFAFGAGQEKLGATSSNAYWPQYGQSIVPDTLIQNNTPILGVAAGDKWSAALDTSGYVHFWGGFTANNIVEIDNNYWKSSTGGYTLINGAKDLLLAIRASDGGVTCFGNCGRFNSLYSGQKNFKKIVWSKGITGFGVGISGNAGYSISSYSPLQYTITGKDELYTFGGLTYGLGYTQNVEWKMNGVTYPIDIGCADLSCFCIFNELPLLSDPITAENKQLYEKIEARGLSLNAGWKNTIELNTSGNWIYLTKNSLAIKTQDEIWNKVLQHTKDKNALKYNSSADRYYLDFTGVTFETYTYTLPADQLNHTTPSYTRNTSHWLQSMGSVDVSGIPVWQSGTDNFQSPPAQYGSTRPEWTRGGIPITKRHVLCVNHFPILTGSRIRFVTMNNVVVERTVTNAQRVPNADLQILLLDSDLPATIKIYKIWDNKTYTKKYGLPSGILPVYGVRSNQYRQLFPIKLDSLTGAMYSATQNDEMGSYKLGTRNTIMLDSGSPVFTLLNNELVLLGLVANYTGFNTVTSTNWDITLVQQVCNSLVGNSSYQISVFDPTSYFEDSTYFYDPAGWKQITTNNKNVFLSKLYGKKNKVFYNPDLDHLEYDYDVTNTRLFTCFGPDFNTFNQLAMVMDGSNMFNFTVTNNAILYIIQEVGIPMFITGTSYTWTGVPITVNQTPKTLFSTTICTDENDCPDTLGLENVPNDLLFVGGDEHIVVANKNKTSTATPHFMQVISVDSPFKRIFVRDLNGSMVSYMNDDSSPSRISIIRKTESGYYEIVKIHNNTVRGIITNKALRVLSKYYDVSNLNPSDETQWDDYLDLLTQYFNGQLETGGSAQVVQKLPQGNPVEIKYYTEEYVAALKSDLATIFKV